jgi:hypothetical protein
MKRLALHIISLGLIAALQGQTVINSYRFASASYSANATTFAGDGQAYMNNETGTFASNGNTWIISVWVKFAATSGQEEIIYSTSGLIRMFRSGGDNKVYILFKEAGADEIVVEAGTSTAFTDTNWHHIITSGNRANANDVKFYVDGNSQTDNILTFVTTGTDPDPIKFSAFAWFIGGLNTTDDMNGCLSEFYIAPGQSIDLTVQANREKWRSAGGAPVSLGSDGSTPTGTAPRGYFKNAFGTFPTNSGTGGNFTKQGTTAFTSCTAP